MTSLASPVIQDWDFPRSSAGIGVLVEYAAGAGVPARRLLAGSGVTEELLAAPDALVTARQELRVVRNLVAALPATRGADVGRCYHVSSFGIVGYALLSSRTLLDAMNVALRFLDLTFIFAIPSARTTDDEVVIEIDGYALPADVRTFLADRDMAAVAAVLLELLDGDLPLSWHRGGRELRFPADQLARTLPQANASTAALCESLCAELASRRRGAEGGGRHGGTAQAVRVLLAQRLSWDPSMAGVAAELGLSARTLRRRLGEEGTRFQALLDEVRSSLATRLLDDARLSVEETAQRLGYAEASTFIQAFRRWHGTTPTRRTTVR